MKNKLLDNTPPKRGPYIGKLSSVESIRREICRVYRLARRSELDTLDAARLANILHLAARLIKEHELEERIEAVEAPIQRRY